MLEAGGWFDGTKQSHMFEWPYQAPHRAAGSKEKPFGYFDATLAGGWEVRASLIRMHREVTGGGGAGACWAGGRITMGAFLCGWGRTISSLIAAMAKGFDWPITYDDLAPYYDKAEELIGVFGTHEGIENTPDGKFLPAPAPRANERIIKMTCDRLEIPCIPSRLAILTKSIHGRAACHYCAQCGRACGVNANFNSPGVHIFPAMKTGNLEVRTGAMVREVLVGSDGLARGVSYMDTKTRQEVQVKARIVVLAASCCETARLLLNSKSSQFPNGLANSTGLVGKYVMDTVGSDVSGYLPILEDMPPHNEDGVGGMHMYMPWWLYQQQKQGKMPFARGYHIEFGGGRSQPDAGTFDGFEEINGGATTSWSTRPTRSARATSSTTPAGSKASPTSTARSSVSTGRSASSRRAVRAIAASFPSRRRRGRCRAAPRAACSACWPGSSARGRRTKRSSSCSASGGRWPAGCC